MRDFRGSYPATMDSKNRVLLPKELRDCLSEPSTGLSFVVRPGRSHAGTLDLVPRRLFERTREQELPLAALSPEQRRWRVFENSNTHEVALDGQSRMLLPQVLVDNARIAKDVVFVGQEDHIQLWSADSYRAFQEQAWNAYSEYVANVSWGGPAQSGAAAQTGSVAAAVAG